MPDLDYAEPACKLLTQGDCGAMRQWPDCRTLGIGPDRAPGLVRMIQVDIDSFGDCEDVKVRLGFWQVFAV